MGAAYLTIIPCGLDNPLLDGGFDHVALISYEASNSKKSIALLQNLDIKINGWPNEENTWH